MNNTPFLSVVVDVVPVCGSDHLSRGDVGYLLLALVDWARACWSRRSAGVTERHGCVTAHEPLPGAHPRYPSLRPHRPARPSRQDQGRMMTFVKRVRSAA